jgi:hypothetical protein
MVVSSGYTNLSAVDEKLCYVAAEVNKHFPVKFLSSKKEERECYMLAVEHAKEIVGSLQARFIDGTCDSDPRSHKNREVNIISKDEELF